MALVGKTLKFDWSSISYEEMTMTLMSKIAKRQKNPEMKGNISELVTEDGCKVYLVGTTHFSKQSIKDVQQIIQEVQPDAVVLEVCKYREQLLTLDEQSLLNGSKMFDTCTMLQSMKQVLLYFSKMIMKKLKQKDRLEEEIQITMKEVPGLYRVLVTERDAYLTQSLKQAAKPIVLPKILRSDAQKVIPSVVVGVVGIGHVAGIKKNWNKQFNTQELLR
ncbi:hypothetical protein chiPu_0012466 [Chiloscyllium punctatum]|uniref:TraB domain-containing protein n=1 Tax=Chiloscyllium punctatum TaxID=137246 RepID=A0A401SUF3_CHIPU|nr:hypothetical protein [Chiloscyllium punctatum]